jgi:hypothetical protein
VLARSLHDICECQSLVLQRLCACSVCDRNNVALYSAKAKNTEIENLSVFKIARQVVVLYDEVLRSYYRDGIKVYGVFVDYEGGLCKRFLHKDGIPGPEVIGAYF